VRWRWHRRRGRRRCAARSPTWPDRAAGTFRLKAKQPFLSNALADQYIGLEEVGDGVWNLVYYRTLLGKIEERTGQITGV
jgi:hypothetical protein